MGVLDGVEKTEIRDVLGKGWLTHDGLWFYQAYREFGIEKANRLNKAAVQSLASIEINRMKGLLGMKKIETFADLERFLSAALEVTLPDSVFNKFHFTAHAGNVMRWRWDSLQCFAYKGMKRIGAIDGYLCGVMYRIECWLEVLGIGYSMQPVIEGCLMHETGTCEGEIQIFLT
jgi:hypothetical protein